MKKRMISLLLVLLLFCGTALADVVVATGSVNIRTLPNRSGEVMTSVKKGERLTYLNETAVDERGVEWYRVEKDGRSGWISSKYAKVRGGDAQGVSKASSGGAHRTGTVTATGKVNLRSQPNLEGNVLAAVAQGTQLPYNGGQSVDERGVTWYAVTYNGRDCWISSRYATVTAAPSGRSAEDASGELSVYCGGSLAEALTPLGLTEYTCVPDSINPNRYTNAAHTLSFGGDDCVSMAEVSGTGWTLYGMRVGMTIEEVFQAADAHALSLYAETDTQIVFTHEADSTFNALVTAVMADGVVRSVTWAADSWF